MTPLKSNAEWQRWGKEDPLWGVATEPGRRRGEASAWTVQDFASAGESDWQDFFPHWRQYGVDTSSCLEIGCGAGRFTKQLALTFDRVWAIDVSDEMIAHAKRAINVHNVEFCLTEGLTLPQADRSVKALFSTHVFQHLDNPQIILAYFREAYRVLDSGGTIMVHLPLYEWPGGGRIASVLAAIHSGLVKISDGLAWAKRLARMKMMRGTASQTRSLHPSLAEMGFRNIEFRTFATSRNNALHSFVLARK
jgi:SAM-dependent methyltransferase